MFSFRVDRLVLGESFRPPPPVLPHSFANKFSMLGSGASLSGVHMEAGKCWFCMCEFA